MTIPQDILEKLPKQVRIRFEYWERFMRKNISFNLTDSEIHTKKHCERVLLFALLIAWNKGCISEQGFDILSHASIFHDTRRIDDGIDSGHGARAAAYYRMFCNSCKKICFSEVAYMIMKYHDQDDKRGLASIEYLFPYEYKRKNAIILYQIFKDADALDRFRLGESGLNIDFLRNQEAVQLVDLARKLVKQTI